MELVKEVYQVTKPFPKEEIFGLTSQVRRAAVSIPSNIAEGHARLSRKEFQHYLGNARGSLAELQTQIILGKELGFLSEKEMEAILDKATEVGRLLNGLLSSLKKKDK
jgi:four helix bundle protein